MERRHEETIYGRANKTDPQGHEEGRSTQGLCREAGISEQTFYRWKSKFGGVEVSEIERMRELEAENHKLKELVADLSLENMILKEIVSKN